MTRAGSGKDAKAPSSETEESDSTLLIRVKPKDGPSGFGDVSAAKAPLSEEQSGSSQSRKSGRGSMVKVAPLPTDPEKDPGATSGRSPPADAGTSAQKRSQTGSKEKGAKSQEAAAWTIEAQKAAEDPDGKKCSCGSLVQSCRDGLRIFLTRIGWYESAVAASIRRFIRGRAFAVVTMTALFFALFFSDICILAQVSGNLEQDILLTIVFVIFLFEFFGLLLTDVSYLLGFFFWMDVLGTFSMVFDISFIWGTDAALPERRSPDSGRENLIVVRAARATKLGARAGRLSRVLKLLRFLPGVSKQEDDNVRMARVISGQLMNVISTRVAFLSICIVIVLPFLGMLTYPEMDDSMGAWTQLLARNTADLHASLNDASAPVSVTEYYRRRLTTELQRFSSFYKPHNYGVFRVCYGTKQSDDSFNCNVKWTSENIVFSSTFDSPKRKSMIREMSAKSFMAAFDLSMPKQLEAIANISLICFIVIVMVVFGLVTSNSISDIALTPLERMLGMVRERCKEIFKWTRELEVDEEEEGEKAEEEDYEETDKAEASEFAILEKVVNKLTAIAHLSMVKSEPEVREGMGEDEIAALNWTQASATVPVATSSGRASQAQTAQGAERESNEADTPRREADEDMVNPEIKEIPEQILDILESDYFDAFVDPETLGCDHAAVSLYVLQKCEGCENWVRMNVQEGHLFKFIEKVKAGYIDNPWHNYYHALDVLYGVARYQNLIEAHLFLEAQTQFWIMVAAIGHDLGHIGVNNQFLMETAHELALRYNDRSPLENMHCARLFQVVGDPCANIFAQVEKDLYKEMRKGIIAAILHTDVVKHNDMVKELGLLYQLNCEAFDALEPIPRFVEVLRQNTQLVVNMLVHGADMSNPMRPWNLCQKYAYLIMEEFFQQGEMEKEKGIPVQMLNNRDTVSRSFSQVGFVEFVIAPMVEAMVNLFSPLDSLAENLGANVELWCEMWIEEPLKDTGKPPTEEAAAKLRDRASKIHRRCKAVTREVRAKSVRMA